MTDAPDFGSTRLEEAAKTRPLLRLFLRYKSRLAVLALVIGGALIASTVFSSVQRSVTIHCELPTSFEGVSAEIWFEGEAIAGVTEEGPADSLRFDLPLSPGDYELQVRASRSSTFSEWKQSFEVPSRSTSVSHRFYLD